MELRPDVGATSATLTILSDYCRLEHLTLQNSHGPGGQALAVTVRGNRTIFYDCNLLAYQDTIFLWDGGKQTYFEKCLVVGRTDYIYGGGIGYFYRCEISSYGGGWVTAPSTSLDQPYGFIFNRCRFTYRDNSPNEGDDGQLYALGRPWHNYPKVTILHSKISKEVHPKGWLPWNMQYAPTSPDLHLYEYRNRGRGADMSHRNDWVGQPRFLQMDLPRIVQIINRIGLAVHANRLCIHPIVILHLKNTDFIAIFISLSFCSNTPTLHL